MNTFLTACSLLPFYLLGTFPTGHLIAKSRGVDISTVGSGNVGATNVMRNLGKKAGVLTLLGDLCKGLLAVALASALSGRFEYACYAGIAVVAGHCFSIPGKLKGGKGVATALGALLFLSPTAAVFVIAVFIAVLEMWKMVSLASVSATLSAPVFTMLTGQADYLNYSLIAIALIITYRHHANLTRIAQGKEPKRGAKTSSPAPGSPG
ncbi:MAG: glycerol-3-phosphate 1-O-acyltransferase PlsY [Deltaproteobacteria bacterium]|nr:glycerol-3-phosphate 1-O-acyltransferase PlsY [Deltaproteobacteria bacterium]